MGCWPGPEMPGYARKKAEEQAKYKASRETYQAYFEKIGSGGTMEEARAIMENWISSCRSAIRLSCNVDSQFCRGQS